MVSGSRHRQIRMTRSGSSRMKNWSIVILVLQDLEPVLVPVKQEPATREPVAQKWQALQSASLPMGAEFLAWEASRLWAQPVSGCQMLMPQVPLGVRLKKGRQYQAV